MGLPEIEEFLRRHRGGRSDEALKQDLLLQGHKPADIEAAFALTDSTVRYEITHGPAAVEEASSGIGIRWGLVALALGAVALVAGLVALASFGRGRRLRAEDAMAKELAAYKPKPFAVPERLALAFPADLIDADAAPDYGRLFSPAAAGPLVGSGNLYEPLESALGKRRCTAALNWYPTSREDLLSKTELLTKGIARIDDLLIKSMKELEPAGAPAALQWAARRYLFGWHMMQDFSLVAQVRGQDIAQAALRDYARLAPAAGKMPPEGELEFGKLALELAAYGPAPEEVRALLALGAKHEDFAALSRPVAVSGLRRPYLTAVLLAATVNWSEEEALAASPWPERLELMRSAREAIDPRAARIGQGYDALLEAERQVLESTPPEARLEAARQWRASLAPVAALD